ncbi:MAG: ATP-binding cassette domain-containing protein, partial [Campylobacterota bacterium]|nr:ATP-binding cassette domain-containing protein [Campylobacterota bacterium]
IIYEQVLNLKMSSFPKSVGSFASNLKDFDTIKNFLNSSTIAILIDLPFAIIFLLVIFFIAGNIVFIPIVIIFLIVLYSFLIRGPLKTSIESTYEASANKNAILIESLSNIETIKYLGASGHAQWELEEATGDIANKSIKTKLLSDSIKTVTQFLIQMNTIAIVIYGVYQIEALELSLGGLIASIILSSRAISPMGQIASLVASYQQTKTAYNAIENIMNLEVERKDGKKFIHHNNLQGDIEFDNVSFKYADDEQYILKNVSFKIRAGEKVAFIGKVGSGKTTIEKLAAGLYSATEGSVKIDGIDINQLNPANLRTNLAYVSQDITLFRGTVKENIIYKAPYVDDNKIHKAAQSSLVYEFIAKHPLGYDMPIQERGAGLSGGQRQTIAIARAILLDSPIVIMDEPTNSLDNQTEAKLIKNLKEYVSDKTLLVVTHKNSLLTLVDRIIVVDNGEIALDGKRDAVLKQLQGGTK